MLNINPSIWAASFNVPATINKRENTKDNVRFTYLKFKWLYCKYKKKFKSILNGLAGMFTINEVI